MLPGRLTLFFANSSAQEYILCSINEVGAVRPCILIGVPLYRACWDGVHSSIHYCVCRKDWPTGAAVF